MTQSDPSPNPDRAVTGGLPAPAGDVVMRSLARPASRVDDHAPHHEVTPLTRMHRMLRGRYHWAILLGMIGFAAGGYGAVQLYEPEYRSQALLHFAPVIPRVLYNTDETGVMPRFDAHLQSQAAFLRQGRTVTRAMESPTWQPFSNGMSPIEIQAFEDALSVRVNQELMYVGFDDRNPRRARAGVQAVVDAFRDLYDDQHSRDDPERIAILEERRSALNNRIRNQRTRIESLTGEFGSPQALEQMYNHRLSETARLESQLQDLHLKLAAIASVREMLADQRGEDGAIDPGSLSPEEIAQFDPQIRHLLERRRNMVEMRDRLDAGLGPLHPRTRSADTDLEVLDARLQEAVEQFLHSFDGDELATRADQGLIGRDDLRRLHAQERQLASSFEAMRNQSRDLAQRQQEIVRLQHELAGEQARLELTERRLEELDVESGIRSRMRVVTHYTDPTAPHNRSTKRQLALFGAVGGGSVGFGLILLVGFMDRRLRSPLDAEASIGSLPLLGLLPAMPEDLADPDQAAIAANGVHHIRTLLQVGAQHDPRRIFTITSPVSGTGKTSLTIALGLSFASSGSRTLLVDCDLRGAGLSHRVNAITRRRIGQILLKHDYLTQAVLDEALVHAQRTGQRLGQALVDRGDLTQEQLDQALGFQEQSRLGILDAMNGEPVEHCIADSGIRNLAVLPVGAAEGEDAEQLSPEALARVLDAAIDRFDTILIDTGPVPGSIEASIAASVADAVVMTVSKGEQRAPAERAVEHLRAVGATIAGLVFNRADEADYHQTSFASLSRSAVSTRKELALTRTNGKARSRFGPLAGAVAPNRNGNGAAPPDAPEAKR
ncbi:MAG: AAA family ATPase [Phycisphaeraceae bacterium]